MEPSSSKSGFFQSSPVIPPQIEEDNALRRIISLHFPSRVPSTVLRDLSRFSRLVLSKQVLALTADAERNQPYLRSLTTFGVQNKQDPLVTSEGWRSLKDIGFKEGIVSIAYEQPEPQGEWNARVYQLLKYHLWTGSSATVTCPSAMSDGAACLLGRHVDDPQDGAIFAEARRRLISRDPAYAWTSGQWMTERKGGSDVRGTETVARLLTEKEIEDEGEGIDSMGFPLGPWRIDGFKWFSSATDADMSILLAKTGKDGQISAFYTPLRKRVSRGEQGETEFNGVRIQRLKNKMGTKSLPTAELELVGMRAYLLGKQGEGVKEISSILNITRVHNFVGGVGDWGRGLAIARAYARVRVASGRPLTQIPAHVRSLAQEHVKYAASMHLAFFVGALLGISEGQSSRNTPASRAHIIPQDRAHVALLLRLLTPMAKAQTALRTIAGLRACLENLGGIGYLENEDIQLNVAKIFRDSCVASIWEGTTDIMADDLVRVIKGRDGANCLNTLRIWVENALSVAERQSFTAEGHRLRQIWESWSGKLTTTQPEQLKWEGRKHLADLDRLVCGCLLILDCARDQDGIARKITKRWILGDDHQPEHGPWKLEAEWDKRIVFGDDAVTAHL